MSLDAKSLLCSTLGSITFGCGDEEIQDKVVPFRTTATKLFGDDLSDEALKVAVKFLIQKGVPECYAFQIAAHSNVKLANAVQLRNGDLPHSHDTSNCVDYDNRNFEKQLTEDATIDCALFHQQVLGALLRYCKSLVASDIALPLTSPPADWLSRPLYSAHAIRNQRRRMEDVSVAVPDVQLYFPGAPSGCSGDQFYAVFDGHGGAQCAEYGATHFLPMLLQHPLFASDAAAALRQTFSALDQRCIRKCVAEKLRSGSTLVCALVRKSTLCLGWAGDSQAALVDASGTCECLTAPAHNTDCQSEVESIEGRGGVVLEVQGQRRVNGMLAVTRSLGDSWIKPPLGGELEVCQREICRFHGCLVMACDGLWDHVPLDELGRVVMQFCSTHSTAEWKDLASHVVEEAKARNSEDNISVICVFFHQNAAC